MDGSYQTDHGGFDGGRSRGRPNKRNATDIGTTYARWLHDRRPRGRASRGYEAERPSPSFIIDMLPPAARKGHAADTIPAKHLHSSLNKVKHPINVVQWTPEGRRLLTGSTSGEFTLWNGTGFNFETIMQAHESAVRAVRYSHNDEWLISADQAGIVKYWQPNFNNVKEIQAHSDPVRDLAFAPTDAKFVTAADDNTLKVWDFATGVEQLELGNPGHSWDVKTCDWHPTKGLIVSGSKDHTIKLWDPRTNKILTTLHGHKNTLTMTRFEPKHGVLLASSAREPNARVFDIRMMRDVFLLKGHEKEISALTWHPIHSAMLTTGGDNGSMHHYLLDEQHAPPGTASTISPYDSPNPADAPVQTLFPAHKTAFAHDYAIWSMDWHPLGHILASGSNDRATRFWTRPRPGDSTYVNDRWHIGQAAAEAQGTWKKAEAQRLREEEEAEADEEADGLVEQKMPSTFSLPGLAGVPGLAKPAPPAFPDGMTMPSFANGPPLPFPMPPGMDLAALSKAFGGQMPPLNGAFPPMPPGFVPPPGFPTNLAVANFPDMAQMPGISNGNGNGSVRKRGPLPSQEESLEQEMRQGRFTKAR